MTDPANEPLPEDRLEAERNPRAMRRDLPAPLAGTRRAGSTEPFPGQSLAPSLGRGLRRWLAPSLVSLAIHALLGIVIGTVAIQTYMQSADAPAPMEIIVDFDQPGLLSDASSNAHGERDSKPSGSSESPDHAARVATPVNSPARDHRSGATPAHSTNEHVDEALSTKIAERLARVNSQARPGADVEKRIAGGTRGALGTPLGGGAGPPSTAPRMAPPATFAGLQASNAQTIAYVVDASGSLIGTLPVVRRELEQSLRKLTPTQRFAVCFFQRNTALEPPSEGRAAGRLVPATTAAVDAVMTWAEGIRPGGRSNPLAALERALALEPDVIFLLSADITGSGEFEIGRDELLRTLDRLNPIDPATGRRPTRIQCVQFLDADPLDTLRTIAERHGGAEGYRFLSRDALGLNASEASPSIR